VLESLGQGSIGSVEKVVRKHHSLHSPSIKKPEKPRTFFSGGIFNDCCVVMQDYGDDDDNGDNQQYEKSLLAAFFGGLCCRFTNTTTLRHNAFQPSPAKNLNNSDSHRSIVSENSAFSAPDLNPPQLGIEDVLNNNSSHGSRINSIRSDNSTPHHSPQHALRRYALKSIRLDRTEHSSRGTTVSSSDEAELRNEIAILRSLDHPHIVHIIETYEYRRSIYLLIDLCEGGDLYVYDPYSESEARSIIKQLCQAVGYIHRRGVVHRCVFLLLLV
jgi:serine/threonine protein kinase